eukprot:gene17104-23401_t
MLDRRREQLERWLWRLIGKAELARSTPLKAFLEFDRALARAAQLKESEPPAKAWQAAFILGQRVSKDMPHYPSHLHKLLNEFQHAKPWQGQHSLLAEQLLNESNTAAWQAAFTPRQEQLLNESNTASLAGSITLRQNNCSTSQHRQPGRQASLLGRTTAQRVQHRQPGRAASLLGRTTAQRVRHTASLAGSMTPRQSEQDMLPYASQPNMSMPSSEAGDYDDSRSEVSGYSFATTVGGGGGGGGGGLGGTSWASAGVVPPLGGGYARSSASEHPESGLLYSARRGPGGAGGAEGHSPPPWNGGVGLKRLGVKLESRADVRKLVELLERRVEQGAQDLQAAVAELQVAKEGNRLRPAVAELQVAEEGNRLRLLLLSWQVAEEGNPPQAAVAELQVAEEGNRLMSLRISELEQQLGHGGRSRREVEMEEEVKEQPPATFGPQRPREESVQHVCSKWKTGVIGKALQTPSATPQLLMCEVAVQAEPDSTVLEERQNRSPKALPPYASDLSGPQEAAQVICHLRAAVLLAAQIEGLSAELAATQVAVSASSSIAAELADALCLVDSLKAELASVQVASADSTAAELAVAQAELASVQVASSNSNTAELAADQAELVAVQAELAAVQAALQVLKYQIVDGCENSG